MADVDDIWAEMQKEAAAKLPAGRPANKKNADLSALQRTHERQREAKKTAPKKHIDASMAWMQGWSMPVKTKDGGYQVEGGSFAMQDAPATLVDTVEEIPSGTPEMFLAYLQRDINCLAEDALGVRVSSLQKLERVLVKQIESLPTDTVDLVAEATLKPLLKRMKDKSEKCREMAVRILRSLVENVSDLSVLLGYVFPMLVARLGCEDLDGVAHLPEAMRPDKEQRPTEIGRPVEESEEVRLELAKFVAALLARCNANQVYSWVDEATGLIRAQAMDPFHEVKTLACETMMSFCYNHTEMLLHFAPDLGRSLTSCLVHNHAKIRIQALRALTSVFYCGVWKHNFEILQILMAWQDPNKVPIKAFYESVTNVNYMSTLTFDRHPAVRRFWFETLANWLLRLPDKVDHEPYLFPYLLQGLCDENEEIALESFWLIEKCGELYESENEESLRKEKQYGFDYSWTYSGRASIPFPLLGLWAGGGITGDVVKRTVAAGPDMMGERALQEHKKRDQLAPAGSRKEEEDLGEEVPLPSRDYAWPTFRDLAVYKKLPRPRLGARHWVRTHTRRYIQATFNDVVDFRECTTLNAGRLLCMSMAYTEEGVTEWLQPMMAALIKFYSGRAWAASSPDQKVMDTYTTVCKLVGVFLDPISYWEQLKDSLSPDSPMEFDQRIASVRVLALCIEGSMEALLSVNDDGPALGMGRLAPIIPELISMLHASDLLLAPTDLSRKVLWDLVLSFLEPLKEHLSFTQVSQLLFVSLALAAKAPTEMTGQEMAGSALPDQVHLEEELEDDEMLDRVLSILSSCVPQEESSKGFSLDDMDGDIDDTPAEAVEASADPRVVHQALFQRAFPEVLACLEDSFQVLRSVLYVSPLAVLASAAHSEAVLEKLASFCSPVNSAPTRAAAQALGVGLALRCAKLRSTAPGTAAAADAGDFLWKTFQLLGSTLLEACESPQSISYTVSLSALAAWRSFFLCPYADPADALFAVREGSKVLEYLTVTLADQELYKRYHASLEHAETSTTGKEQKDFVVAKSKLIRESAEERSHVTRATACSTVLLAMRRVLISGQSVPWLKSDPAGSMGALFSGVTSLFREAKPTMEPLFVRATPSFMYLYAAEILHLTLHCKGLGSSPALSAIPKPFRLVDDAAQMIHSLPAMQTTASLPVRFSEEQRDALALEFVNALVDLNLTLPPDPNAKHAPASLDAGGDLTLGWDQALAEMAGLGEDGAPAAAASKGLVPAEVVRLLKQSPECLSWNAALALYVLGVDLTVVAHEGFQKGLAKWRKSKQQSRVLITADLLERATRTMARSVCNLGNLA